MDVTQRDHLKAYGVAFAVLEKGGIVEWLLNYRGGSFRMEALPEIERYCLLRGVTIEQLNAGASAAIDAKIEQANMEAVRLEKAPKVAVYAPAGAQPWDDAVRLALEYAEIPYTRIYDEEVLGGKLPEYDWLHLHHEDFTGQYGKFYGQFRNADWYVRDKREEEARARKLGFAKVSQLKGAVAATFREYVQNGGFLFSMCSGTDALDIALAAQGVDIVDTPFDGDPPEPQAQTKLQYSNSLAFTNFHLIFDPMVYEFSDIDTTPEFGASMRGDDNDYFSLFEFAAKFDPVATMLTQSHTSVVKGFMGQTTAFHKNQLKPGVSVLGEIEGTDEVKYIHGILGKGTWTFFGGHDPEDYRHRVGDPPTDLNLHRNSPGYRLILNNVLFPAAKKKELKT
ncbi:MAG: asparagine synthetase B [bacterium]|nr:asparagine synthetase B [bacterium]